MNCGRDGGPIKPLALSNDFRSATKRLISRARVCALTIPATEFSSAIATADRPRNAARSIYSSGCEPPLRKEKFEQAWSSAQGSFKFFVLITLGLNMQIYYVSDSRQ